MGTAGRLRIGLIGTLDTKEAELGYLRERLRDLGAETFDVDVSVQAIADVPRAAALASRGDAAGGDLLREFEAGRLDGAVGVGGTGGTELAARAMRLLPRGVPKLILSTVGAGIDRFIGTVDLTVTHAITDIAGLNPLLKTQLDQLAAAAVAMAGAARDRAPRAGKVAALTMFGVTTTAGEMAADELRSRGWEVIVFHANGAGGSTLEDLAAEGAFDAVLDLTTTELADEVAGGQRSAGSRRLTTAGRFGLPQVVSLGALDVVNFGPLSSVPDAFAGRSLYRHGENVTLMRASVDEARATGALIAERLNAALGPVIVVAPLRGFSELDRPGGPFEDAAADAALRSELSRTLSSRVLYVESDHHLNDEEFARDLARRLDDLYNSTRKETYVTP